MLPDGRRLVVRQLDGSDTAAVSALYHGLSDEDRRLRFFSTFRPTEAFVRRWLTGGPKGDGLVLGAFVDGELAGEAGYSLLANGNAELGVTTNAAWRGWLGPFLLDHLVEAARQRGVPNLEAQIRLDNGPMLALVRSRGFAVVEHPDWSEVRVVIGTDGRVPGWPADPGSGRRPRVLVEAPGGRWSGEKAVVAAGFDVITCPGPGGRPGRRCPVLEGRPCPLVEGADAIIVAGYERPPFDTLATAHRDGHPETPVVVAGRTPPDDAVAEVAARLADSDR